MEGERVRKERKKQIRMEKLFRREFGGKKQKKGLKGDKKKRKQ